MYLSLNKDRFAQGLPDPQADEPGMLGVCQACGAEIHYGDGAVMMDDELYCDTYCLAVALGAVFI